MDDPLSRLEIARRTLSGSLYKLGAQVVTIILGFIRAILLARMLSPADFGLVALALFFAQIGASLASFGLNAAFIQKESIKEDDISTHFILRIVFSIIVFFIFTLLSPLLRHFYPESPLLIPIVLTLCAVEMVRALTSTPIVLLTRSIQFKRLALIDVSSSAVMLLAATVLAWQGWGPWSIVLGEHLTGALITIPFIWMIRPPWRLSLKFSLDTARQYLAFGKYILFNLQIDTLLDQFDDFWTASSLGSTAAGFYTKAYEFARNPRRVIVAPLQTVFYSGFARLKNDRDELSNTFYQITAFITRLGFLVSLILILTAPEIITLLLTSKWLPMLRIFQLLLIYTLFDPLLLTIGNLLMAVGQPQLITRIKIIQLIVFIPLVIFLTHTWGVLGAAGAADIMLILGLILILRAVKPFVDFSVGQIFAYPTLALLIGFLTSLLAVQLWPVSNLWISLILKTSVAGFTYLLVLLLFEHRLVRMYGSTLVRFLKKS